MQGKIRLTSEQLWFILGFIVGTAVHEPITLMVGL